MSDLPEPRPPARHAVLDPAGVRALAHPLRMRLLAALRLEGAATASMLARRLGESSGLTSYHLRALAEAGFVEDAPDLGSGRERWWRAAHDRTSWTAGSLREDPDTRASEDALYGQLYRFRARAYDQWLSERGERDAAWVDAAAASDTALHLTPEQLAALRDELEAVVDRFSREVADPGDPRSEQVLVFLDAFPLREVPL